MIFQEVNEEIPLVVMELITVVYGFHYGKKSVQIQHNFINN